MEQIKAVPELDEAIAVVTEPEQLSRTDAAQLAAQYFLGAGGRAFSGAAFEHIGHPWSQPSTANLITPSDLLALGTLMVPLDHLAAVDLLTPEFQTRATALLEVIPLTSSIGDSNAPDLLSDDGAASQLYELIKTVDRMGKTRASKLLARKRPGLIPIRDENVEQALGAKSLHAWWKPFHQWANESRDADGHSYLDLAQAIHSVVGLGALVTPLRTLDAVLWRLGARDSQK